MLLLSSAQVEYCNVTRRAAAPGENLTGIIYQDKLFVQGECFSQAERKIAAEHCRQKLEQNVMCLLTEDATGFTVWYEGKDLALAELPSTKDSTASNNLENLVLAMQDSDKINVKDRWHNLKLFPQCFIASEAVAWLMNTQNISKQQALNLGEQLIQAGLIQSVNGQPFQDGLGLYRFSSKISTHQSFQLTRDHSDKHQSFRLTL